MRLDDQQESSNVEDRRGSSGGSRIGGKSIGIGTIALALVAMYFGVDPSVVLNMGQGVNQSAPAESGCPRGTIGVPGCRRSGRSSPAGPRP